VVNPLSALDNIAPLRHPPPSGSPSPSLLPPPREEFGLTLPSRLCFPFIFLSPPPPHPPPQPPPPHFPSPPAPPAPFGWPCPPPPIPTFLAVSPSELSDRVFLQLPVTSPLLFLVPAPRLRQLTSPTATPIFPAWAGFVICCVSPSRRIFFCLLKHDRTGPPPIVPVFFRVFMFFLFFPRAIFFAPPFFLPPRLRTFPHIFVGLCMALVMLGHGSVLSLFHPRRVSASLCVCVPGSKMSPTSSVLIHQRLWQHGPCPPLRFLFKARHLPLGVSINVGNFGTASHHSLFTVTVPQTPRTHTNKPPKPPPAPPHFLSDRPSKSAHHTSLRPLLHAHNPTQPHR